MASTYDQFSTTSNKNSALPSVATRRTSINALLNPEPDEQQNYNVSLYQNNGDVDCSSQQSQVDSAVSQSMPTSPMSKHSDSSSSEYNGINSSNLEKSSRRSMSSSLPPSRRSSMNRASGSGQSVTSSSNDNSNMITPPQTPGIKSPTKANFSFPPSSNGTTDCNDQPNPQQMPPKVKRKRITQEQLQDLVAMFEQTDTPSYDVREKLAKKLNMTNREVQVWFQNRRAKANRAKANEHNASHQHHRFLHHHSVSTTQAASGHASSINMMPGNFTFVPMFTNGSPSSTGGPVRRSNRRHSYVPPSTNNNQKKVSQNAPHTRPRASTVTGVPMTSMSSHISHAVPHSIHVASQQQQSTTPKMMVPPPIKILSYDNPLHGISHHSGYGYAHSVPPSPISPMTPISPTTPTLPPINYMLSINNLTLPPPVPPIKTEYQQPAYQSMQSSHNSQQTMLPTIQSGYSDATSIKSEPSPIDLLATAAELVQSEEKEKERLKALADNNNNVDACGEETGDDKKWRPWLI